MPATSDILTAASNGTEAEKEAKPAAQAGEKKPQDSAAFSLFCDERGYLNQIEYILQKGVRRGDRTGTGTISMFGLQARYSLRGESLFVFPKVKERDTSMSQCST